MFEYINEERWNSQTKHFFSCRWHLGQGTVVRNHLAVMESSKGGIEVWHKIHDGNSEFINTIYDTRILNRKLRKFVMEN